MTTENKQENNDSKKTNKKTNSFAIIDLLRYTYRFSGGKRSRMFIFLSMQMIVNILDQIDILLAGYIFNYIQVHGVNSGSIKYTLLLISLIFVMDVVSWSFHGPARVIEQRFGFYVSNKFRDYLYKNTLDLPITFHNSEHSGQLISKINKGVNSLELFSSEGFMLLKSFSNAIAIFLALFIFNYKFAIASFIILFVTYYIVYVFESKINPLRDAVNKKDNILSEIVYDTVSNITTIKMLSLSKIIGRSLEKETKEKFNFFKKDCYQ